MWARPARALPIVLLPVLLVASCTAAPAMHAGRAAKAIRASARSAHVPESSRPGSATWRLRSAGPADAVQGYADKTDVAAGESFRLFVSTTAHGFRAVAYRMGWYQGKGGREVWRSPYVPGIRQAAPTVDRPLNTVSARWRPSLTVTARGWPEGSYLIKLSADNGHDRYVPITVRSTDIRGKIVLMNAVTTWQAYNLWGGYNLYQGRRGFSDRSRVVSFDRPYERNGADKFLTYERPVIELAERLGLPLAYVTNIDLATDPTLLDGARALVTLGHDEYWSTSMRAAATRARDAGTNIAFLGANAINRHIRLESSRLGPDRLVVCYKSAAEDPVFTTNQSETTQDWRLPPDPRPESVLTGAQYDCFPAKADYVVADPRSWLFAGTGARAGTRLRDLVGVESDRLDRATPFPRPIEVLADSPLLCGRRRTRSNSTYYTVPSGAGVVNVGTMNWVPALGRAHRLDAATWRFAAQVTTTLLRVFARGPAGRTHPARDNLASAGTGVG
jgi:hypothetical protein